MTDDRLPSNAPGIPWDDWRGDLLRARHKLPPTSLPPSGGDEELPEVEVEVGDVSNEVIRRNWPGEEP